jgi:hypothetical protein
MDRNRQGLKGTTAQWRLYVLWPRISFSFYVSFCLRVTHVVVTIHPYWFVLLLHPSSLKTFWRSRHLLENFNQVVERILFFFLLLNISTHEVEVADR